MTISRVTTWEAGNTLTATALNGEFDNLITAANTAETPTATGTTTARAMATRLIEYVNVKDFGALGNDSADDTAAIQLAFDYAIAAVSATVVFPRGVYRHTALTLAPGSGAINVNLLGLGGAGSSGVVLKYTGTGGTALTIKNNTRFRMDNLRLTDAGTGAKGLFITSLAVGSSTGPGVLSNIYITGFTKNYVVGESGGESASEFSYYGFEVDSGTSHGVEINGANSLNHTFYHLNMTSNAVGLEAVDPDNIYIYGGSSTSNTTQDFAFRPAGAFGVYGYRSEGGNVFVTVGPDASAGAGSPTNMTIANCRIAATGLAANRAIRLHKAGQYSIHNNHIQDGHISILMANTVSAYVDIRGNLVVDGTYLYEFEDNNTVTCEVECRGNRSATASAANYWTDEHFIQNGATKVPLSSIDMSDPTAPKQYLHAAIVATGSLPAAATAMNGRIIIEDAGSGNRNLLFYAGGERFRIDGGANI